MVRLPMFPGIGARWSTITSRHEPPASWIIFVSAFRYIIFNHFAQLSMIE